MMVTTGDAFSRSRRSRRVDELSRLFFVADLRGDGTEVARQFLGQLASRVWLIVAKIFLLTRRLMTSAALDAHLFRKLLYSDAFGNRDLLLRLDGLFLTPWYACGAFLPRSQRACERGWRASSDDGAAARSVRRGSLWDAAEKSDVGASTALERAWTSGGPPPIPGAPGFRDHAWWAGRTNGHGKLVARAPVRQDASGSQGVRSGLQADRVHYGRAAVAV